MESILTTTNVLFTIVILNTIFSVYNAVRRPQLDAEFKLRDGDKRDELLQQKIQWMVEGTEKRFLEMQNNFKDLLLQSNNHIHTVDTKVDVLSALISTMGNEVTKLGTIIDERIPKK